MNNFPRKNIEASAWLWQDGEFYVAYLKIGETVYTCSATEDVHLTGYISGEARRVAYSSLPEEAQIDFGFILEDHHLTLEAHGLAEMPEWIEVEQVNGYTIYKRRRRFRKGHPIKIIHKGEEVWKGKTIHEATKALETLI